MIKKYKKSTKIIVGIIIMVLLISAYTVYSSISSEDTFKAKKIPVAYSKHNIENSVKKIVEIYNNKDKFIGENITISTQYLKKESLNLNNNFLIGFRDIEYNGKKELISILAKYNDLNSIKKLDDLDWIKVTGEVQVHKEQHGDHNHEYPIIEVKSIEKIPN